MSRDREKGVMGGAGKRILIINANDLGYTRGINEAIRQCSAAGMLRSATLMANGPAFDDAVAMVRDTEILDVGVHLVLTKLPPVSPPAKIRGLIDERGHLPGNPWELAVSLLAGGISRDAIRQELSSQITKILDYGLQPTHLDSHKHVHVLPRVLEVVIELANKFSIPWILNPFDEIPFFSLARIVGGGKRRTFCLQHLKASVIGVCRPSFHRQVMRAGVRLPDHFCGVSLTGLWNEAAMVQLFTELSPGVTEWMVHPGNYDEDLLRSGTRLAIQREKKRDLLTSPTMRERLVGQGITLSSFRAEVAGRF
jgi:chitin disaccharide deacetylase